MNKRRRTRSVGAAIVGLAVLGFAATACSSSAKTKQTTSPTTSSTTTTVLIATTTTLEPPTTTLSLDQIRLAEVDQCTQYVPIAAFSGVKSYVDLWNFVGQDATQLAALCDALRTSNPTLLDTIASDFQKFQQSASTAGSTPSGSTPSGASSTTAAGAPVSTSTTIAKSTGTTVKSGTTTTTTTKSGATTTTLTGP